MLSFQCPEIPAVGRSEPGRGHCYPIEDLSQVWDVNLQMYFTQLIKVHPCPLKKAECLPLPVGGFSMREVVYILQEVIVHCWRSTCCFRAGLKKIQVSLMLSMVHPMNVSLSESMMTWHLAVLAYTIQASCSHCSSANILQATCCRLNSYPWFL